MLKKHQKQKWKKQSTSKQVTVLAALELILSIVSLVGSISGFTGRFLGTKKLSGYSF
jgi:hypothetical protein